MDNRFKQYKALISDVYDSSKMEVVQPKGKYALLVEDPIRGEVARKFALLIKNTDFVRLETKLCLLDNFSTCESVINTLKREYGVEIKKSNLYQIWYRDRCKIIDKLGDTFMNDLVSLRDKDVTVYLSTLQELLAKKENMNIREQCILNLGCQEYAYTLEDEEFNGLLNTIRPYMKRVIHKVENGLSREGLAYLNHIMTHEDLKGIDLERYHRLVRLAYDGRDTTSEFERSEFTEDSSVAFGTASDESLEALGVE